MTPLQKALRMRAIAARINAATRAVARIHLAENLPAGMDLASRDALDQLALAHIDLLALMDERPDMLHDSWR